MIDLRTCKEGDILISSQGTRLKYLRPTNEREYLDHVVEYEDPLLGNGTRTHDGFVFKHNRIPETDHDIIKIIKQK
jgi:hypothetical protein